MRRLCPLQVRKEEDMNRRIDVLLQYRRLILDLAVTDLKARYASSFLGLFWACVQPVVTVAIYALVFGAGFRMQPQDGYPYVPWLVAGMIPWICFQDTVLMSAVCLKEYSYLVKKVVFDVKLLPVTKAVTALMIHMVFLALCILVHRICRIPATLLYLQLPWYLLCNMHLALGTAFLVSALNVFFPDLQQIVSILLQFGIWMTPVMWHETLFGPAVEKYVRLNPMYYVVSGYRDSMCGGPGFWEKPVLTLWFWLITLALLFTGIQVFRRLERHFADVL